MKIHTTDTIEVFQTIEALNCAAAKLIIDIASKAIAARGEYRMVLSGGQTPMDLYLLLTTHLFCEQIAWNKVFIFWGDERYVATTDKLNNAHQAKSIFLNKIDIPLGNIYPIPIKSTPTKSAAEYEKHINSFFKDEDIKFDLVLLGLGKNGHTASLFPNTQVLNEQTEGIREVYVEEEKMFRITMTAPLINKAHNILFLVTGGEKAKILESVLSSSYQPNEYPAQLIKPLDGKLYWFVDQTAASLINL